MKIGKKTAATLLLPLLTLAAVWLVCLSKGVVLFETQLNTLTFIRSVANVSLVTYALSINLNSGRFDFSVGSVALVSSVIGAKLALSLGTGPWAMLFLSVFF